MLSSSYIRPNRSSSDNFGHGPNHPPDCLSRILKDIGESERNSKKLSISNTRHIHDRLANSLFLSGVDTEEVKGVLNEDLVIDDITASLIPTDSIITTENKDRAPKKEEVKDFWREIKFDFKCDAVDTQPDLDSTKTASTVTLKKMPKVENVKLASLPVILLRDTNEDNIGDIPSAVGRNVTKPKSQLALPDVQTRKLDNQVDDSSVLTIKGADMKYFGTQARSGFFDQYKRMRQQQLHFSGVEGTFEPDFHTSGTKSTIQRPMSSNSLQTKPKFDDNISSHYNRSSCSESKDLFQGIDDDTLASHQHNYFGSGKSQQQQRMSWKSLTASDSLGDSISFHTREFSTKQLKRPMTGGRTVPVPVSVPVRASNLTLKSGSVRDRGGSGSGSGSGSGNRIIRRVSSKSCAANDVSRRMVGEAAFDSLSVCGDDGIDLDSPISPRSKFLGFCIEEGINPMPKMLIRGELSSEMNLAHYGMGDKRARALATCLHQIPAISSLNLADNNLTDASLEKLFGCIERMTQLTELNLSRNKIDEIASNCLARFVSDPQCPLKKLVLQHADVDDFECVRFVQCLKSNHNLRELDLSDNLLGSAENLNTVFADVLTGGECIAEFITTKACRLESLKLAGNSIRLESAVALAKAIAQNHTLTTLDLSFNGLGQRAGEVLGDAIQSNSQLRTLLLASNGLNGTACFCICVGVIENRSLEKLCLDDNPIGEGGARAIMQVPLMAGGRVDLSAASCNTAYKDSQCWFDHHNPVGDYTLHLDDPFERGVAISLLHIIAGHTRLIFSVATYERIGKPTSLQLVQTIADDAEKYFNSLQRGVLEGLRLLQAAASNIELAHQLFDEADADESGELDKSELKVVLERLGFKVDEERMNDFMAVFDVDGAGAIEKDEFITLMRSQYKEATVRIHDMTHYPMMALAATPTVRYVPPRVGVLRLRVIDGYTRKRRHKTVSATDQKFVMEMAKNVGSAQHLADALKHTKLRFSEAYETFKALNYEQGNIAATLSKVLPQVSNPLEARQLLSKATRDDPVKVAQVRLTMGLSLKPIFGLYNGYYCLDLSKEVHRVCLGLLLEQGETVNSKRRQQMELTFGVGKRVGDTSFKGDWSAFRNSFLNGEPADISPINFAVIPKQGIVEFDFSGGSRPDGSELPISDARLLKVLNNLSLLPSSGQEAAMTQLSEWRVRAKQLESKFGASLCACDVRKAHDIALFKDAFYNNLHKRRREMQRAERKQQIKVNFMQSSVAAAASLGLLGESDDLPQWETGSSVRETRSTGAGERPFPVDKAKADDPEADEVGTADASDSGKNSGDGDDDKHDASCNDSGDDRDSTDDSDSTGDSDDDDDGSRMTHSTTGSAPNEDKCRDESDAESGVGSLSESAKPRQSLGSVAVLASAKAGGAVGGRGRQMPSRPVMNQTMRVRQRIQLLKSRIRQLIRTRAKGVSAHAKAARIAEAIEETFSKVWIRCRHLALIVRHFEFGFTAQTPYFGTYMADLVVNLFVRLVDKHNFELVMNELSAFDCAAVSCRLGLLNIWNPCKPDGAIELNMAVREERLVAKMMVHLSVVEPGDNLTDPWFQWKRTVDPTPGFHVSSAWLTEKEMPPYGYFRVTYFSGDGMEKKGCKPDILTRKALTACVLVDENEMYGEDEMPPLTKVNSADIHFKTHKNKDVWTKYLFCSLF